MFPNLTQFPGQVYRDARSQAAMTLAIVILVLLSIVAVGYAVKIIDNVV
jgi:hypothetical protein